MGYLRTIAKSAAAGVANGALFYVVFAVGHEVVSALNPVLGFAVGFASAVAVALFDEDKQKSQ